PSRQSGGRGRRDGDVLALAIQVRAAWLSVRASGSRARRPEHAARGSRSRRAGSAGRRLLRPPTRRAGRCRRPRRGVALRARAGRAGPVSAGLAIWFRLAAWTGFAAVLFVAFTPPRPTPQLPWPAAAPVGAGAGVAL